MRLRYVVKLNLLVYLLFLNLSNIINAEVIVFRPELFSEITNYNYTWYLKRTPVEFYDDKVASNCAEYNLLLSQEGIVDSTYNSMVKSEYLSCELLYLIGQEPVTLNSSEIQPNLGEVLANNLDLRSFYSSFYKNSDADKHTLATLDLSNVEYDGVQVKLVTDYWKYTLEVVAVIKEDNEEDWVIWLYDEALEGRYRDYSTLIAANIDVTQPILAKNYP